MILRSKFDYWLVILVSALPMLPACDDCAPVAFVVDGGGVDGASRYCGDGVTDFDLDEQCDDADDDNTDICRNCLFPRCGDGVRDMNEYCDDGNDKDGDGCSIDCTLDSMCGNSLVEAGEVCDDGNTDGGDNCSADCKHIINCGDGITHPPEEECDDGNNTDGDGCSATCQRDEPMCGNYVIEPYEVCDDGNTDDGDGCSGDCRSEEVCGNLVVDFPIGEECEVPAPDTDTAICDSHDCTASLCGDGYHNQAAGEFCDAQVDTDMCDSGDCTRVSCGDGYLNTTAGEECDDGNIANGDGCDDACMDE